MREDKELKQLAFLDGHNRRKKSKVEVIIQGLAFEIVSVARLTDPRSSDSPAVTKGKLPNSNVEDFDSLGDAVQAPVKNDMVLHEKLLTDKPLS
ncbi:hypothetical protein BELL_0058g00100 [Botrytis elliptica]|uniref:Uncharacterized protein n=1 Tax=Botrytis elliptica TaxID=278938 RepID=A0A4Z1JYS5_9HELO|nr:hypothetical protein BELL_0058g00100 [Botrytis elliptica]